MVARDRILFVYGTLLSGEIYRVEAPLVRELDVFEQVPILFKRVQIPSSQILDDFSPGDPGVLAVLSLSPHCSGA